MTRGGRDRVDHYGATYGRFAASVYAEVRSEAFGEDIGQTGWLSAPEHDRFLSWLRLDRGDRLLDVACGSGGPTLRAVRLTGCTATGIDLHADAIRTAREQAGAAGLAGGAEFLQADASGTLPFPDAAFDAVICVDAINHLPDRAQTLREWARVLRPAGRVLFTDPVVVTGAVTGEELRTRSAIGTFLFVPAGYDEQVLEEAGFALEEREDRTGNMARIARRWHDARAARADVLREVEGDETFEGQQQFFEVAARLATERRLSRVAFAARRP